MNCVVRSRGSLLLHLRFYAATAKLKDIPFQPKLANAVNLIGEVQSPIQFQISPDGNAWASTVLTRQDSPNLSIPVIFEGDLAHRAKCHLKQNDCIHVAGKLTTDAPHLQPLANMQVMVQTLNFVQGYPQPQPKHPMPTADSSSSSSSSSSPWRDLIENPKQWCDFRDSKRDGLVKPKHPDFKGKGDTASLWLNKAPDWVLPKLQGLQFDVPTAISKKGLDSASESWNDLVRNLHNWWDNRLDKRNEKAPDFKHKETGKGLWLNSSPKWVLEKLPPPKPKQNLETDRKQQTLVS